MSLKTILALFFFKFFNVWFGDRVDGVFMYLFRLL